MEQAVGQEQNRDKQWLTLVQQPVTSRRYGVGQIVVHDARAARIQKTEELRLKHIS